MNSLKNLTSRYGLALALWSWASTAFASGVGGGGGLAGLTGLVSGGGDVPWNKPVQSVQSSLTGVVGPAMVVGGAVLIGVMIAKSGEIREFGQKIWGLVIGGAIVAGAGSMMGLFGSGTMVP